MSHIIVLMYGHKHSAPSSSSPLYSERHAPFSPSVTSVTHWWLTISHVIHTEITWLIVSHQWVTEVLPSLLLKYLMLVLPYSHGQPTLSLHMSIRRSNLKVWGKTHTSPHLCNKLQLLLTLYKEENLHLFCTGRSLGHATVNQFDEGYNKLCSGKLKEFIYKTTMYGDVIADIEAYKKNQGRLTTPHLDPNENLNEENSQQNLGEVCPAKNSSLDSYSDSHSDSDTSSSHAVSQESLNEIDPSNNHLVSGSGHSMHISEGRLLHQTWYDKNQENIVKAVQNERPQTLVKWTLSMHPNKTLDRKVGLSVISLHSLLHKCSGSTQITCHLIHSFITSDNWVPAFHASLRVSWQYKKAETFSFDSSKT